VSDVASANVAALTKGENDVINVATGIATTVNALYEKLARSCPGAPPALYAPARTGELERSVLSFERAQKHLGWKPQVTLEQGLGKTYAFFEQQRKPSSHKD